MRRACESPSPPRSRSRKPRTGLLMQNRWLRHTMGGCPKRGRSSRRAVDLARQAHQDERAALYLAAAAVRESFLGDATEARRLGKDALRLSTNRDVEYGAAFALVKSGFPAEAEPLIAHLESGFPEDTYVKFTYLPVLRALIAVGRGQPAVALALLEP